MNGVAVHPLWGRLLLLAVAVLDIAATVWTATHLAAGGTIANFFSYFTIQSNLIIIAVWIGIALFDPQGHRWQLIRCAATLYILITGVVYTVLLQKVSVGVMYAWTNDVLHRVTPLVAFVDWLLVPAALGIGVRFIASLLAYPLVYGVYTLIRGPIVDWYPYPFIDPRDQGYGAMAIGLVFLVIAFVVLAVAVAALGEMASRWRGRRSATSD